MRAVIATLASLLVLGTLSAQTAPSTKQEYWQRIARPFSFALGDQGCGEDRHLSLRRDWRGEWYWGPCVPNVTSP
jgi:hypothetical protein